MKDIEKQKKEFFEYHEKAFERNQRDLLKWGGFKLIYTKRDKKK